MADTEKQQQPAVCEHMGDQWGIKLYGTLVFRSRHENSTRCLASDINCAIRRHEEQQQKGTPK